MPIIKESIRLLIECKCDKNPYADSIIKQWIVIIKGDSGDGGYFLVEGYGDTLIKAIEDLNCRVTERAAALEDGIALLSSCGYEDDNEVTQKIIEEHQDWEYFRQYLVGSLEP